MSTTTHLSLPLKRAFDSMFRELWKPPGCAAALCDSSGMVWRYCFGERDARGHAPVDETTLFALASGTKTMAAATIAQLCDQRLLDWDSRIVSIDAAFDAGDATVTELLTLRDLACHRTGWTSSEGRHRGAATSRADLVRRIRHHGFRHQFRERFAYCTDAFTVLGHAVDVVTGKPWELYARERLLEPLGMQRTFFSVGEAQGSGNFASPHVQMPKGDYRAIPWKYEDGVATPAGGANSCLVDLAAWLGAWLGSGAPQAPWSTQQQRLMLEPQIAVAGEFADPEFSCAIPGGKEGLADEAYALGWYCHRYRGERVYHHTGSIHGFRSLLALLPERNLGFAVLVNADAAYLPRAVFQAVLDDLQGSAATLWTEQFFEFETRWHEAHASAYQRDAITAQAAGPQWQDLPGSYRDDGRFASVRIVADANGLSFEAGRLLYRLVPLDGDTLQCLEACGPISVDRGTMRVQRHDGVITGFGFQGGAFRRG